MFWETDGLSPYSHLSKVHRRCRWGEKDSGRKSKGSRKEAGCSLASLGKSIHQNTSLWQQMKRKKTPVMLYFSRSCTFLGAWMNKLSYFTLTVAKAGCWRCLWWRKICLSAPPPLWLVSQSPTICVVLLVSVLSTAEHSSLGKVWGRDQWIREDLSTLDLQSRAWLGGSSPNFWSWAILWSPTFITLGTLGPWALSGPSQVASFPQHLFTYQVWAR